MKFNIEIKNVGTIPALILKQELLAIDRTILDTPDPSPDRYLFRLATWPSNGRNAEWQKLQRDIYKPFPPSRLMRTLAPNETWTFELTDWFYIGKNTNVDPNSKPWNDIRQASPVWIEMTRRCGLATLRPIRIEADFASARCLRGVGENLAIYNLKI